jgi:7-cyano-7-deazaguanine synthase in queuosine biosynthesis
MKILILYSGGLDSYVMNEYAKRKYSNDEIIKVWFDIGQEYNYKERKVLTKDVDIRKIDWIKNEKNYHSKNGNDSGNIFIPGRNAVLILLACSIYQPDEIWLGSMKGEDHKTATDKNEKFRKKINKLIKYVYSPFKTCVVRFPFVEKGWGKFEVVKWALENGIKKQELLETSSCLSGEKGNCGECVVCIRRWGIFGQLGFEEKYNVNPLKSKIAIKHILSVLNNNHYDKYRKNEIIPFLEEIVNTKNKKLLNKFLNNIYEDIKI